ncbi:MAG TPA: archaellin/type IV pilin N-terminal domain-containing protein [Thermoplasmata archaeon]|nr:archaellin/type IV pilin N-terminal domain-containing protein [Thermoplasmata archaeon]
MMRSTRRRRRPSRAQRAVSPIIATILLVAIAVVLAAVLYALVAGFAHPVEKVPLGSAFYAGPANAVAGSTQTSGYCQASHYCYAIPVDLAQQGIAFGDLNFLVLTVSGTVHIVTQNSAQLSIVTDTNTVAADSKISKNGAFEVTSWQKFAHGLSGSTPLAPTYTLWVQFGNTKTSPYGQGMTLEVVGAGGFSGSLGIMLP